LNVSKKLLGQGTGGCIYCPPILDGLINNMIEYYPKQNGNSDYMIYNKKNHIGKLLIIHLFINELNNFRIASDTKSNHIPTLKYAGIINNINNLYNRGNLEDCMLYNPYYNHNQLWGYIISDNVGTALENYTINNKNIITILKSLKIAIENFIIILNNQGYLHGDIHLRNITINNNNIYFIDFDKMKKIDKNSLYLQTHKNYDIIILFKTVYNIFFFDQYNAREFSNHISPPNNILHKMTTKTHAVVTKLLNINGFQKIPYLNLSAIPTHYLRNIDYYTPDNLNFFLKKIIESLENENTSYISQVPIKKTEKQQITAEL
jgi:hypothetical protein